MNTPSSMPLIHVQPVDRTGTDIDLACFPATLDPSRPGIRLHVTEYDANHPGIVVERRGRSSGPVLIRDRVHVEVRWEVYRSGERVERITHWLDPQSPEGYIRLVLREVRRLDGSGYFEDLDLRIPARIETGKRYSQTDITYRHGTAAELRLTETVDGPFSVAWDDRDAVCFRVVTEVDSGAENRTETYVDVKSGYVVLQRTVEKVKSDVSGGGESGRCSGLRLVTIIAP